MKAVLVLEDGTYFSGQSLGAYGEVYGEVVFNTSMAGYQEIITDPSYNGHIVIMTYPLIGNYGFNSEDVESLKIHVEGFAVKELCEYPNNWRNEISPNEYFVKNNIVGIKGIDTRALAQHIRQSGSMYGVISTRTGHINVLLEELEKKKRMKRNLVDEVSTREIIHIPGSGKKVAVLDFGINNSVIKSLENRGCDITILPCNTSLEDILSLNPDGVLLSNGPGDPRDLPDAASTVRQLTGIKPIFGVGLGLQVLALALGLEVFKLKFGHHGPNHSVKDFVTGRCYVTSQNHNFAVINDRATAETKNIEFTHININDGTIEGIRHKELPLRGIQFYPETSPGLGDASYLFDDFVAMM